jgi:hypothetical protein
MKMSGLVSVSTSGSTNVADMSEQFSTNPSIQVWAISVSAGMAETATSPGTQVTYLSASSALNSGGIGGVQAEIKSDKTKNPIALLTLIFISPLHFFRKLKSEVCATAEAIAHTP